MIIEEPRLFGIIPMGLKRSLKSGEYVVLSSETRGGFDEEPLETETTRALRVVSESRVIYRYKIGDTTIKIETDRPEEINTMKIRSSGCLWNRVYTYVPDAVSLPTRITDIGIGSIAQAFQAAFSNAPKGKK